jgi:hypothetical protein
MLQCNKMLEYWDRGFDTTLGMDVGLRLLCVRVGSGLATG